ncbi:MAG TPA: hypothetical protein VFD59_20485 [Nocardioidaceae bacterium]|nr:hypothetical protein [Nocardioidaceae bacterium]
MDPQPVRFLGRVERAPVGRGRDKELDVEDPYELVGMRYPVPEGVDGDRELARCFVEEFALMGWPAVRIRELFTEPSYTGAHEIASRRGMNLIDDVLTETFGGTPEPEER